MSRKRQTEQEEEGQELQEELAQEEQEPELLEEHARRRAGDQKVQKAEQRQRRRQRRAENIDEKRRIANLAKQLIPEWLKSEKIETIPVRLTEGRAISVTCFKEMVYP